MATKATKTTKRKAAPKATATRRTKSQDDLSATSVPKAISDEIATLIALIESKKTQPKPAEIKGYWSSSEKTFTDCHDQVWDIDGGADPDADMDGPSGLRGRVNLMGESKITPQELLDNLKTEGPVDIDRWSWPYNRNIARPENGQFVAWYRPVSRNPRAPHFDILVNINYSLWVFAAFPDYEDRDETKAIIGYNLRGKTEAAAREDIRQYEANRNANR